MLTIVGDRRSGKTTALIRLSELTGARIVCPNAYMADAVWRQARRTGHGIERPVAFDALARERPRGNRTILVDELEPILYRMGYDCLAVTVGWEDVWLQARQALTLRECLRLWWDGRKVVEP